MRGDLRSAGRFVTGTKRGGGPVDCFCSGSELPVVLVAQGRIRLQSHEGLFAHSFGSHGNNYCTSFAYHGGEGLFAHPSHIMGARDFSAETISSKTLLLTSIRAHVGTGRTFIAIANCAAGRGPQVGEYTIEDESVM